jgi:hypothetical protein
MTSMSRGRWGSDAANQGLVSHHFEAVNGTFERRLIPFRYVWPSELDLMARLAGMTLRDRFGSWEREPFTSESTKHISVWQMPMKREEGSPV